MSKASNAVLALCRAYYGKRLSEEQYFQLSACRSLSEFASALKSYPLYSSAVQNVSIDSLALEEAVTVAAFGRYDLICRYERAIGDRFYEYFLVRAEIDEILKRTILIFGNNSEEYVLRLSPFIEKRVSIDLFSLARAETFSEVLLSLEGTRYFDTYGKVLQEPNPTYLKFEDAFEKLFDAYLSELVKKCFRGGERNEIIEIIKMQRDARLILRRMRICKYYPELLSPDIQAPKDLSLTSLSKKELGMLYSARSREEIASVAEKAGFKGDLSDVDKADVTLYARLFAHIKKKLRFSSFPGTVTYCYLFLSENEVRNLKRIIEGIKYDIPREEIKQKLFYE